MAAGKLDRHQYAIFFPIGRLTGDWLLPISGEIWRWKSCRRSSAKGGKFRGWLGVEVQPLTRNWPRPLWAGCARKVIVVSGLYREGPALAGGLQPGDIFCGSESRER